uniref:MI domain-containing protein n=1 Tax=Anopheles atroparvus TaxID=41427 RepID=A0AAG5DRW4_ANOAO
MKMKMRPQKNVRLGRGGGRGRHKANKPKSRKDLRKEARQQKKLNRFNHHNRSQKERVANGADELDGNKKKHGKFASERPDENSDQDFEDEEIESDFSDSEEPKSKSKPAKNVPTQMDVEREREMLELKDYEASLKEKRIEQLEAANEEDDRVIKKYEKLLKINRGKNKQGVAKSFNDGLDYALELCTEENIGKMYEAAKEAAELDENSSDEFIEDLQQAVGGVVAVGGEQGDEDDAESPPKRTMSEKERKRVEKLKKIEEKYLGLDEIDDLGEYDSEMELEVDEKAEDDCPSESDDQYDSDDEDMLDSEEENMEPTNKKRKVTFAADVKSSKHGKKKKHATSDSEEDEELIEKQMKSKKKKTKNGEKQKQTKSAPTDSDEEELAPGRFVLLKPKAKKKSKESAKKDEKQCKKNNVSNGRNKKKVSDEEEEDEDFDSDVFGGDTDEDEENDGLDDLLNDADSDDHGDEEESKAAPGDEGTWEDIYGRKRDKAGNVIKENHAATGGKYVPPHLRAKLEAETAASASSVDPKKQEKLMRLKRQLKGQINRLAESNVHRISIDLDHIYMQNARHDMNSTLATLILEAIVAPTLTPDRMVLEHVLLVAILHANVGSEVGSHFLETVVERFLALAKDINTIPNEAKQLDNCIQILCHLYTFEIVKCKLVHEVLQKLVDCFNEKSVECILLLLRSIGFILRKDDPLALKDLILAIQKKAANAPDALKNDTRVKFMLETLLAVKNNNMNKIPQYDPTLVEHFRKLLKGMIASGKYVSTLNIGLQDIIDIPQRGKWWLVGSAWHGNKDAQPGGPTAGGKTPHTTDDGQFSQQLLELARRQRMNTDDRRNVFCVVMSAEDYLDAFEKLLRLAIKDLRVVVSVIIHCSLAEKEYNPYYSVLSQKFCDYDRRYQLAIQFALWDRLKEIHSLQQQQIRNLARFIAHIVAEGGLAISCLKVIDFAGIDKVSLRLMRQIMLGLLLLDDENKCLQVFSRITASFKLKSFKDSLRLFMLHFLARGTKSNAQLPEEQAVLLQNRIKQADQLLGSEDTRFVYEDD